MTKTNKLLNTITKIVEKEVSKRVRIEVKKLTERKIQAVVKKELSILLETQTPSTRPPTDPFAVAEQALIESRVTEPQEEIGNNLNIDTGNSTLNEVLRQTKGGLPQGAGGYETLSYTTKDTAALGMGLHKTPGTQPIATQIATTGINGVQANINNPAVKTAVLAQTKDYREFMKDMNKSGNTARNQVSLNINQQMGR